MLPMPPSSPSRHSDALQWQCQKCHQSNTNSKRCSSCRAWKAGITPFRKALKLREEEKINDNAANFVNRRPNTNIDGSSSDENTHPNFASTRIGTSKDETTSPSKGRNKKRRVTPSSPPSLPLLPPSPQSHRLQPLPSTQPSSPPSLHQPSSPLVPEAEEEGREIVVNKCRGVYAGCFGQALTFFAKCLRHTASEVLKWVQHPDKGVAAFMNSIFATSKALCLPFYGLTVERAENPAEGFIFRRQECCEACDGNHQCCSACLSKRKNSKKEIKRLAMPPAECPGKRATIHNISNNPTWAAAEIRTLRETKRRLERQLAIKQLLVKELAENGKVVPNDETAKGIRSAIDIMDRPITEALESNGVTTVESEIWRIHAEHIRKVYDQGGKGRGFKRITYHPTIMNWAIAFLARTSSSVYKDVQNVMMLPDISYVYRKTAEMVSTNNDKAWGLHLHTIRSIAERAKRENWTNHQRIGVIAQDSANIKSGIEHDYKSNKLKGGDETFGIANLSKMFQALAQEVKDAESNEEDSDKDESSIAASEEPQQTSILDSLILAKEHLVFKFTIMDPNIECSEVVAAANVNQVTPAIITMIMKLLRDTLPFYGLELAMATCDAAGSNWASFRDCLSTNTYSDALPRELTDKYPTINFDVKSLTKHPRSKKWIIFVADMPHLTKNIVTCLEKSSLKSSKRNLKYGKAPMNLRMIEEIWLKMGGASGQLQATKLTKAHFDKNAFSRMNVKLSTQILSQSTAEMIRQAIEDDGIVLGMENKGIYSHLANFCDHWNRVVDICNGRDGASRNSPHTPANASERQTILLKSLEYFNRWKELHVTNLEREEATAFNFFADETWFCINNLLLSHVTAIQIYCVEGGESINPRTMNTDTVEWHFADARQMVGGSTNKLTSGGFDDADKKASTFNAAKFALGGNNKTGDNLFGRKGRF